MISAAYGALSPDVDRATRAQEPLEMYRAECVEFVDTIATSETPDAKAEALKRAPAPISYVIELPKMAFVDARDEPAFQVLSFVAAVYDQPGVRYMLARTMKPGAPPTAPRIKIEPFQLLLEHHASRPEMRDLCARLPAKLTGLDDFLRGLLQ
jgi:hypothetical protein